MPKLYFTLSDKTYSLSNGKELLEAYRQDSSMPLRFGCCSGTCGTCAMKVISGQENLSRITKQEKETLRVTGRDESYRLACQCAIVGDVVVEK